MQANTTAAPIPIKPGTQEASSANLRPEVRGKFLWVGEEKFYVRGVTYGPFHPDPEGVCYPPSKVIDRDFAQIASNGLNTVRTYDVPPIWLLDLAARHGLRVMVGLQVEQRASFLDDKRVARRVQDLVRSKVRACAGHPAILAYVIANEIPAPIVRWHGARRVEGFLEQLYGLAKSEDPDGLFGYANYPTTEYLDMPFLELACFNVFLESEPAFRAYLARLQNLSGNRPLIMTEVGLDSRGKGEVTQAEMLDWQIRTVGEAGCAGACVFSWTDDWYSRGRDVEDWAFGLTDRDRKPKLALQVVRKAFDEFPFASGGSWPRISVVVCSFNGSRTIRDCLEGLTKLRYPNYEVIVVDDGSTDQTPAIAKNYPFRLISTPNRGLSAARNTGYQEATGEIVAYIDDDASPDPDWLSYLAIAFRNGNFAGVGGPNIPFPNDGPVASCVANSPGGPTHVLLTDTEAEHIPGCNMTFRKSWLEALGGFDRQFRVAGDDVDLCWRLRQLGGKLGFSPAAMVWHHYRGSVRAYWKQQKGYGKAEALLERKWPEKYNSVGHIAWAGRIYGQGLLHALERRSGRIYQGTWGSAAYGRLYGAPASPLLSLALMPEWYLLNLVLLMLCGAGYFWRPLFLLALPLFAIVAGAPLIPVVNNSLRARVSNHPPARWVRWRLQILTAFLHALQPLARLRGRLGSGLSPWRRRSGGRLALPRCRTFWLQSRDWRDSLERLPVLESVLKGGGAVVRRGSDFDPWDLEIIGGLFGGARVQMADEVDGTGQQLVRARAWPRLPAWGFVPGLSLAAASAAAILSRAGGAALILGTLAVALATASFRDCAGAIAAAYRSLRQLGFKE